MAAAEGGAEVEVIHQWSAPRSLSTSLMYSFAQRDDVEILDEPLYANFLKVTGADRPYRDELLAQMESDGNKVVREVIFGPGIKRYRYCKHIAKQRLPNISDDLMRKGKHFILIRNPLYILPSFDKVVPPSFLELGLGNLVSIYSELCEFGTPPPIVDAEDLTGLPGAEAAAGESTGHRRNLRQACRMSSPLPALAVGADRAACVVHVPRGPPRLHLVSPEAPTPAARGACRCCRPRPWPGLPEAATHTSAVAGRGGRQGTRRYRRRSPWSQPPWEGKEEKRTVDAMAGGPAGRP